MVQNDSNTQDHTSSILALPPEVMGTIFEQFLPQYPEFPSSLHVSSPLFLARICRRWRQIALSTPTLWCAISVDIHNSHIEMMEWKLELLKEWLVRSGDCPLSLRLSCHPRIWSRPHPIVSHFLRTAVLHCTRWEYVHLLMPSKVLYEIKGDMPMLKQLTFGPCDCPSEDLQPLTLFDCAPQLATLVLLNLFSPAVMHLPWAQITHLEGRHLYEHEGLDILAQTPRLIRCILSLLSHPSPSPPLSPVSLPHLRYLVLRNDPEENGHLAMILDNLTAPALRTLRVTEPYLESPIPTLQAFLSRSRCTLENLWVVRAAIPIAEYRQALPSVSNVIHSLLQFELSRDETGGL